MKASRTPVGYDLAGSSGTYNVRDYGAAPGNPDNAQYINAAILAANRAGGGVVIIPSGSYICLGQINLLDRVTLQGDGVSSFLDFDGADASNFPSNACVAAEGSLRALPSLAANISEGDRSITFASDPGLSVGDVIAVLDPNPGSFNPGDVEWRAGEMFEVFDVSSSPVIGTGARSFDGYTTAAGCVLWALQGVTVGLSGLRIRGIGESSVVAPVFIDIGIRCWASNLDISGSQRTLLEFRRSYDSYVENCRFVDNQSSVALNTGLKFANCQRATAHAIVGMTTRHAVVTGGGTFDAGVVNREIVVANSQLTGRVTSAFNWHGNSQHCIVHGCSLRGGCDLEGSANTVSDCDLYSNHTNGVALQIAFLQSFDHKVINNRIYAEKDMQDAFTGLVQWNRSGETVTVPGGTLTIRGNTIDMRGFQGDPVWLITRDPSSDDLSLDFSDNTIIRSELSLDTVSSGIVRILGNNATTSFWRSLTLRNNTFLGAGLEIQAGARNTVFHDNVMRGCSWFAFRYQPLASFPWADELLSIQGNLIHDVMREGIKVTGHANTNSRCLAKNNVCLRTSQDGTWVPGSSSDASSFFAIIWARVDMIDNLWGDDQAAPTQQRVWATFDVATAQFTQNQQWIGSVTGRIANTVPNFLGTRSPELQLTSADDLTDEGRVRSGSGDPNGSVVGNPGDLWLRTDGGAGTTLYVKESGVGTNAGWIGK